MLQQITRALRENPGVHDWQVRTRKVTEHQLYLIGQNVESRRSSFSEVAHADLFHDHPDRGVTSLTFIPGQLDDMASRIERGVFMASLVSNPRHELPGPAGYEPVQVHDSELAGSPWQVIDGWRQSMLGVVAAEPGVRLSAAEFFIYDEQLEFANSRGAAGNYPSTKAFIEFVLLSQDEQNESENYHSVKVRAASQLNLEQIVREHAGFARDMLRVRMPHRHQGPVVISGDALGTLFDPFFARVNGQALYRKIFQTRVGDCAFGQRAITGDPLNLSTDPTLPFGLESAPFDDEGVALRAVPVLKDGHVQNLLATKRYADYLGLPVTGAASNTVVGAGSVFESALYEGPVCHLVSFAELHADPISGDFVTEIRLGYEIGADGSRQPIKGGSLSGNVFDAFASCHMSRETATYRRYHGPKAIRFENLTISGE